MFKGLPIVEALITLAVSAVVLIFGKLTLDKWDAQEWGLMILGIFATIFAFSGLVAIVKHLIKSRDDEGRYRDE